MIILDGKKLAAKKTKNLKTWVLKNKINANFTIIQVGDNEVSNIYIKIKMKKAEEIGFIPKLVKTKPKISQKALLKIIANEVKISDGLIIQLPIAEQFNKELILNSIPFNKDIDGLSKTNQEKLYNGQVGLIPATARGIISLLKEYNFELKNKKAYVIGESNLVGKPIKHLLKKEGSITRSFNKKTTIKGSEEADILVVAVGAYKLIKKENIKKGAIIIDVGISTIAQKNHKYIIGDVDFNDVKNKAKALSPVPGGVGPMTVISLFENLKDAITKFKN